MTDTVVPEPLIQPVFQQQIGTFEVGTSVLFRYDLVHNADCIALFAMNRLVGTHSLSRDRVFFSLNDDLVGNGSVFPRFKREHFRYIPLLNTPYGISERVNSHHQVDRVPLHA